ncbi:COX15/CtaA family protein [Azorhizobium doebereinerae]|uniref:COX15/CtaA family protein n=1 Tax=Azorhizobium doebereinerae TaxID=281091 RepID=UPI00068464F0
MSQVQGIAVADAAASPATAGSRAVRMWLYVVAALIVAMVVVGGATRLTESGLSITEWKPVTGALPPLSDADWQAEFDKYKTIPQYEILNKGMGLEDFKRIFWWEWAHRLLGRVIGLAFFLPFVYFAARGMLRGALLARCLALFLLGGLQGAVGWWMVASGLTARTSVSQYRLAIHLTLACVILAAVVAVARGLTARGTQAVPRRLRATAYGLVGLVLVQIFAGGLVAGLDAGLTFNTWPLMDGRLIPAAAQLGAMEPAWRNLFENVMTVQFVHRMIAYTLFAVAILHALDASRTGGRAARGALLLLALVSVQATLGILTLVHMVPLDLALAHQLGATLVLVAATVHASDLARSRAPAAGPALLRAG